MPGPNIKAVTFSAFRFLLKNGTFAGGNLRSRSLEISKLRASWSGETAPTDLIAAWPFAAFFFVRGLAKLRALSEKKHSVGTSSKGVQRPLLPFCALPFLCARFPASAPGKASQLLPAGQ